MTTLQLVVPCFNEADRLDTAAFVRLLESQPSVSLLFVDDGSTDGTPRMLRDLAARPGSRVSVLTLPANGGKGRAVRAGMNAAFDCAPVFAGYWDADLSTPLTAIPDFLAVFVGHPEVDIVTGARVQLLGRRVRRGAARHYLGRVFGTAASLRLGIAVYDTQCGAKIFRAGEPARALFRQPLQSNWAFDVEILARYVRAVGRERAESGVYELPLNEWIDKPGSKLTAARAVQAAIDLLRVTGGLR